jgi:hypothetical protein
MNQKKDRTEIEKKIISNVKREMKKPRLAESVRNGKRTRAAPIAMGPARSEKV